EPRFVAGLGGLDEIDCDQNVLLEQVGKSRTRIVAVEGHDGVPDVFLISQQSSCGGIFVRRLLDCGDDVLPRPDHMVGPKPPHPDLEPPALLIHLTRLLSFDVLPTRTPSRRISAWGLSAPTVSWFQRFATRCWLCHRSAAELVGD